MPRRVDRAVLEGFFAEVRSYLPRIHAGLDAHHRDPSQRAALQEVHRFLHSIKGTSAMVGMDEISRAAGDAEERVEPAVRDHSVLDDGTARAVRDAADRIGRLIDQAAGAVAEGSPITVDVELAATVAEELGGYLDQIGAGLRAVEANPQGREPWAAIWRPVHTIKGTAGIVGLHEVSRLAHRMEDLLTGLEGGEQVLDDACLRLLFRTVDLLVDLVEGSPMSGPRLAETYRAYSDRLDVAATGGHRDGQLQSRESSVPAPAITVSNAVPGESFLRVRADRLDGILRLVGDVTLQRNAFDLQVVRLGELRGELQLNLRRLGRIGRQLETELDAGGLVPSVVGGGPVAEVAAEFDSLEMDRYSTLNRLARQLEEATSDSAAVGTGFDGLLREVEGFQGRLGLLARDLQERLAQLRTVPFASIGERLHRTVRVTAERRGKRASLVVCGDSVELDKDVIDEIAEPLLHLLRNAVDHGIESPDRRVAAGKPRQGQIEVEVGHEGTEAVIRIRDDGAGLELERIRERATALGVLSLEDARSATDGYLRQLLFQRGFSTASAVSEVSGRGIGLDVVQASIDRLRGVIEIDSTAGQSTSFTIRLPGSQSILRVLLVASGGEVLAIPLASVDRVESVTPSALGTTEDGLALTLGDTSMPAFELDTTLGLPPRGAQGGQPFPAIVLRVAGQRLAVVAERILGVQETVMRPMSELFASRLYGFGGAALTGDGTVVLVLNPNDLIRRDWVRPIQPDRATATPPPRALEVLIVDDSLSVRQILSRLVESHGWRSTVARDGEEALERLSAAARVPDVALVDLEMPRMDGFELTRALRASSLYRRLPIVILTTRAGRKHRQKAFELGVTDYLVKPYQEQVLLDTIRDVAQAAAEDSR